MLSMAMMLSMHMGSMHMGSMSSHPKTTIWLLIPHIYLTIGFGLVWWRYISIRDVPWPRTAINAPLYQGRIRVKIRRHWLREGRHCSTFGHIWGHLKRISWSIDIVHITIRI